MGKDRKELESAIMDLNDARTEDDILRHLIFIAKGFEVSLYKHIFSNPYYKTLLSDVKKSVMDDLDWLKSSISEEIAAIDDAVGKEATEETKEKLKELRRDCISLIYEVDRKMLEIKNI